MSIAITRRMASLFVLCFLVAPSLLAATFTVTSGATTGPGSLEQAILDANATPGRDQIVFAVSPVATNATLPPITDPVDIDGSVGTGRATVSTTSLCDSCIQFAFNEGSDGSTIRDLRLIGPAAALIHVDTGVSDVAIAGIVFTGVIRTNGDRTLIGGPSAEDEVRRSGAGALEINLGTGTRVQGVTTTNIRIVIATDVQIGTAARGNTFNALTSFNSPGLVIENNTAQSIDITQVSALSPPIVEANTISGGATAVRIHAPNAIVRNNIISNTTTGVLVPTGVAGVAITGNSIVATGLPIDLGGTLGFGNGPTPNDPAPDTDTGANDFQNFPVLTSATLTPSSLVVTGTLTSAPLTPYQIELFSNDAANPDARTFLGAFNVTTDATGVATFSETITSPLPVAGEVITSTATNRGTVATPGNSPNSTSEVSAPIALALPGGLGFQNATQSVDEAAGTVSITVTRIGGSEGTVTVDYATTNGTAMAPGDFTQTSGTLTFGPGVTTQTIVVPLTNDDAPEGDETFTVTLTNPTGGATIGQATTTITITDTDAAVDAAPVPTASTWALIAMALGLALVAVFRS
ncbi:MAG TPA: Calx-beta domain-containing protein [Thermoanaerobaculia bacterium]|nr:Calx-beta domain-containing protein [Thermoanaerobaculia bacterium]